MDDLPENLQTSAKNILFDDTLTKEQKLLQLNSLGITEKIFKEIVKKMESSDWLITDNSLNFVPANLTVAPSEESLTSIHPAQQEETSEKADEDSVKSDEENQKELIPENAETANTSESDSLLKSSERKADDERLEMIHMRKYNIENNDLDSIFETPIQVSVKRQEISHGFGEDSAQCIHIFFNYTFICTLNSEDSLFTPENNGDYIAVFQKDAENIGSLQRMIAHLMVADDLAENIKDLLTGKIIENLDDPAEIDDVENVYIPFERWAMLGKWAAEKNKVIQSFVVALIEDCSDTSITATFDEQNSPDFSAIGAETRPRISNTISTNAHNDSFLRRLENRNGDKHEQSLKESFLAHFDSDVSLRDVVPKLIDTCNWNAIEIILESQSDTVRVAYQQFRDEHVTDADEVFSDEFDQDEEQQEEDFEENSDVEDEILRNNLDLNSTEPMTIVFMGETGAGKSTLINSFVNYLTHKTLNEAKRNEPTILIPVQFEFQDKELRSFKVRCTPTIPVEDEDLSNEYYGGAESCTQHAKSYLFRFGPDESQVIRVIDTPGVADVRGLSKDKENFDGTLRYLSKYPHIDAILFVLKPNESVLSLESKYCIQQLLTHLHKSAAENILFCFTNTQLTGYKPGDTLVALQQYFDDFFVERNIRVTADRETCFCFDNAAFRYLCAVENGYQIGPELVKDNNESWKKSHRETLRLLEKIRTLPPHKTEETLSINNIRRMVALYATPLAKMIASHHANIQLIMDEKGRVEELEATLEELRREPIEIDLIEPVSTELPMPVTVCTNEKTCVQLKRYLSPKLANYAKTNYVTKCHKPCYLTNVQVEKVPNEDIKNCHCFEEFGINKCSNCGCPWDKHMHIRHKIKDQPKKVKNKKLDAQLKDAESAIDAKTKIIKNLQCMQNELEEEIRIIKEASIEFVLFLKKYACSAYNDVFGQIAEQLIKEERQKVVKFGIPDTTLCQMEKDLADHKNEVNQFQNLSDNAKNDRVRSIEEIDELLEEIRNLPRCAKLLKDVEKYEWMSIQAEQNNRETSVSLHDSWINHRR